MLKAQNKPQVIKLALLTGGFCIAIVVRIRLGGLSISHSPSAGLVFALCLTVLSVAAGLTVKVSKKIIGWGLIGAIALCLPVVVTKLIGTPQPVPQGNYFFWGLVVSLVAISEEIFLRGVFYDAIKLWRGEKVAILVCAIAFAVLHIPLYGLGSLPLNVAVGLWLGTLRWFSGSWVSPGITHTLADLAAWWLR